MIESTQARYFAAAHARFPRDEDGAYCPVCSARIPDGCPSCDPCVERSRAIDRRVYFTSTWSNRVTGDIPRWPWAGGDEWAASCPRAAEAIASWEPHSGTGLAIFGPTGAGKTSALVGAINRLYQRGLDACAEGHKPDPPRILWTSEAALVRAQREHPLGKGTPDLIRDASRIRSLVVDEVGFARGEALLMEIVDARYRAELPTTITSGRTRADFVEVYGDALYRRIGSHATIVDLHGES
ncbi:MAG: ATP-binding protein [Polyangiaceae bacterium]